jgi:multiple sugar transport system substrate-binding protein
MLGTASFAAAGGIGAAALAACGQQATPSGGEAAPKHLRSGVAVQWGVETKETRLALRKRQQQLFAQQFPSVKVKLAVGSENVTKIKTAIAAGTPPDLVRLDAVSYPGLARSGGVTSYDALIKRDKYDLKDFFPAAIEQWQWRGKQWAMPFLGVLSQFYNAELVQQAGARTPPNAWKDATWNWDGFLDFAKKITRRQGDTTTRWAFVGTHENSRYYMPWVWSNGGDMFDKDYKAVTIGDPPALQALAFVADLMNKHHVAPTPDELKEIGDVDKAFTEGKIGMLCESVNQIAANRLAPNLRWTMTALPRGKKGVADGGGGVGWFIPSASKVQDETWGLLKTVLRAPSDKDTALSGEAPPNRRSVANTPEYLNPKEPPGADMKVVVESLDVALHTDPVLIQGSEILEIFATELAPTWAGQRSARESAAVIKQRVNPMLALEHA